MLLLPAAVELGMFSILRHASTVEVQKGSRVRVSAKAPEKVLALFLVLSCLVLFCLVLSCVVLSCLVVSRLISPWSHVPCLILSCLALPCLSCLIMVSCTLSYLSNDFKYCVVLSWFVLSCLPCWPGGRLVSSCPRVSPLLSLTLWLRLGERLCYLGQGIKGRPDHGRGAPRGMRRAHYRRPVAGIYLYTCVFGGGEVVPVVVLCVCAEGM